MGVVAPVSIRKGSKPVAPLLVSDGEVCGLDQVAKQVVGCPHVSFHGRGQDPLQLVDHVEDAVAGDLIAKLLSLVQGQFLPYSGKLRGVAAFHAVLLYHVLRVVFLLMAIVPFSYSRVTIMPRICETPCTTS